MPDDGRRPPDAVAGAGTAALTLAALAGEALARLVPAALAGRAEFAVLGRLPQLPQAAFAQLRAAPAVCDRTLVTLAQRCAFSDLDLLAVAIARAVELDLMWSRAVAALQATPQGGRPMLGLVARAYAALDDALDRTAEFVMQLLHGAALRSGVLHLGDDDLPAAECSLALRAQLLPLLASAQPAPAAATFGMHGLRRLDPPPWALPPSWTDALGHHAALLCGGPGATAPDHQAVPTAGQEATLLDRHQAVPQRGGQTGLSPCNEAALLRDQEAALPQMRQAALSCGGPPAPGPTVGQLVLRATAAGEAAALAAALGRQLQRPVVQITRSDAAGMLPPGLEAWCLAQDALPLFVFDLAPGEQAQVPPLAWLPGPALVAMGPEGDVAPPAHGVSLQWRIERPPPAERAALWAAALGPAGAALDHDLLARRYCSGVSTLHAAAAAALARAAAEGAPPGEPHIAAAMCEDIVATTHGLSALAQWIPCRGTDAAFVGEGGLRDELGLVLLRCQWREQAGGLLGPAIAARSHAGVRLLFIGASGTGKTLAAQWLAEQLGKPLFRVDIAAVSSKYIGETEKNLAQLLARAEQLDCVLLFDEADSMFGARTEVSQANDRFANAQTNYLLQRIETFCGVTVLTSNNKARFDDAFMRRLDHVIEFPLPRGSARAALWQRHLGTGHGLSEAQLAHLGAEIDLPGGNLRNIVLGALLHATREGGAPGRVPIGYAHVLQAAALEYAKLGRRLPDALLPQAQDVLPHRGAP